MTTLHQMAVATGLIPEYREMVRGYFPAINERRIRAAFAAMPAADQERAKSAPDGRYFDCHRVA